MKDFAKKLNAKFTAEMKHLFSFGVVPRKHFRKIMITTTILACVLVVVHIYLFRRVEDRTLFVADTSAAAPAPTVDETKLTTVLNRFSDKALIRATAVQLTPAVSDPSR